MNWGWRWLKFNLVGGVGICVQLSILTVLKSGFHLHYLAATAGAVEATILHNFLWHERFTWADRAQRGSAVRLLKFHLTTGVLSLAGNLALMRALVGVWHVPYLAANCMVIAACSLVNFVVSNRFVFADVACG